jgi:hypothetical protein
MSYLHLLRTAQVHTAEYTPPWLRTPRDIRLTAESAYWRARAETLTGDAVLAKDLHRRLDVPPAYGRAVSRPIAQAMRSLGWVKRRSPARGYRPYLWERRTAD